MAQLRKQNTMPAPSALSPIDVPSRLPAIRAVAPETSVLVQASSWKSLYRYWLSKHVDGRPPARTNIDPVIEIPHLVANLMLMDVVPEGYRYRLLGSEIVARHNVALTGKLFGSSGIDIQALNDMRIAIDYVAANQKPRLLAAEIDTGTVAKNTLLILPLVTLQGRTEMILIGSFYNEFFRPESIRIGMTAKEIEL
jgi:hypothetical protein